MENDSRRDAERMSHWITGVESPIGESLQQCPDSRFPIFLRARPLLLGYRQASR